MSSYKRYCRSCGDQLHCTCGDDICHEKNCDLIARECTDCYLWRIGENTEPVVPSTDIADVVDDDILDAINLANTA